MYVIIGDDEKVFIALAPASLVQTGNKSEKEKNIFLIFCQNFNIKNTIVDVFMLTDNGPD